DLPAGFHVLCTRGKNMFGTAELWNLCQQNCAAAAYQQIGAIAESRICRYSGKPVRASAFYSQNELADGNVFTGGAVNLGQHLLDVLEAELNCCLSAADILDTDLEDRFLNRSFTLGQILFNKR